MRDMKIEKQILWEEGGFKLLKLHFDDEYKTVIDNEEISSEAMTLEEVLCDESVLKIGKCSAKKFTVQILNNAISFKNVRLNPTLTINPETEFEDTIKLGSYIVESENKSADKMYKNIVAYDDIYRISNTDMADWYNNVFPTHVNEDGEIVYESLLLKQFRDKFFEYFGIEQIEIQLPLDDIKIEKTVSTQSISGLDILEAICEINGCYGQMNYDGQFTYIYIRSKEDALYPSDDLFPSDQLYPIGEYDYSFSMDEYMQGGVTYEDYITRGFSAVTIRQSDDDIGYSYPSQEAAIDNPYVITNNILLFGTTNEVLNKVAQTIYDKNVGVYYVPGQLKTWGKPWLELGDTISVQTRTGTIFFPILKRTMSGITALKDTYEAKGEETYESTINSTGTTIEQLKGKSNELIRTIDETKSTIVDMDESLRSEIVQTAGRITSTVAQAQNIWDAQGYTIDFYDYSNPNIDTVYDGEPSKVYYYFLNQSTGIMYRGHDFEEIYDENEVVGFKIKTWDNPKQLELITDNISSKIEQMPNKIELSVNDGKSDGTPASITLTIKDSDGNVLSEQNSEIHLNADTISLEATDVISLIAGNKIDLTANQIEINSSHFNVSEDGHVEASSIELNSKSVKWDETGHDIKFRGEGNPKFTTNDYPNIKKRDEYLDVNTGEIWTVAQVIYDIGGKESIGIIEWILPYEDPLPLLEVDVSFITPNFSVNSDGTIKSPSFEVDNRGHFSIKSVNPEDGWDLDGYDVDIKGEGKPPKDSDESISKYNQLCYENYVYFDTQSGYIYICTEVLENQGGDYPDGYVWEYLNDGYPMPFNKNTVSIDTPFFKVDEDGNVILGNFELQDNILQSQYENSIERVNNIAISSKEGIDLSEDAVKGHILPWETPEFKIHRNTQIDPDKIVLQTTDDDSGVTTLEITSDYIKYNRESNNEKIEDINWSIERGRLKFDDSIPTFFDMQFKYSKDYETPPEEREWVLLSNKIREIEERLDVLEKYVLN